MKKQKLNNYAFIDSQNLYLGVKSQGWKLDYGKFRIYLKEKYQVERAFIFIGYITGNESLYTSLQQAGYIGVFKPTLPIKKGNKIIVKGNVDAELVLHTMVELPNYDKVVIVSGDGDFHCLVEHLDKKKKLLKLLVPNKYGFSHLLRKFRDYVVFLHDLRSKVEKKKERE